jgi:hypothetical protein
MCFIPTRNRVHARTHTYTDAYIHTHMSNLHTRPHCVHIYTHTLCAYAHMRTISPESPHTNAAILVCMCMYMCMCICVCLFVCLLCPCIVARHNTHHTHTHTHTHTWTTQIHEPCSEHMMHVFMCTHILCMHIHTCVRINTRTLTHTHTHTHTHAFMLLFLFHVTSLGKKVCRLCFQKILTSVSIRDAMVEVPASLCGSPRRLCFV